VDTWWLESNHSISYMSTVAYKFSPFKRVMFGQQQIVHSGNILQLSTTQLNFFVLSTCFACIVECEKSVQECQSMLDVGHRYIQLWRVFVLLRCMITLPHNTNSEGPMPNHINQKENFSQKNQMLTLEWRRQIPSRNKRTFNFLIQEALI